MKVALRRIKDVLWTLALLALVVVVLRLTKGLGATTALSDKIPWGFWKVLNMVAGVALATGGFVMAFAGHVLGIRSLKPLIRPAILLAFLGYGSSCFALLMDIGLPFRFYNPFFHWNEHSFLFEVFWCVTLYFTVTVLELAPIALEESKLGRVKRFLGKISGPVVILGITFSCLHHSSLGSLFLVSPTRLDPLWYSPFLPLHFFLSAVGAGLMMVILLTLLVARLYRRQAPVELLGKVAAAAGIVLSIYFASKVLDLALRGAAGDLLSGRWEARLFLVEMLLSVILPVGLVLVPRMRRTSRGLAVMGLLAVTGLVLNRLDVGVFGYFRSAGTIYVPTLPELSLTLGIPAAAGLVFFFFVERFRIFDLPEKVEEEEIETVPATACTAFQSQTGVWTGVFLDNLERWSLILVIVVPVALGIFSPRASARGPASTPVSPPRGADEARAKLKIDGNRNGRLVLFDHEAHKKREGGEEGCGKCHHLDVPGDRWTACYLCHRDMDRPRSIFDHGLHEKRIAARLGLRGTLAENHTCTECHPPDLVRARENTKRCVACHEKDMRMPERTEGRPDLALSYRDALHERCVRCHEKQDPKAHPGLTECAACHSGSGSASSPGK